LFISAKYLFGFKLAEYVKSKAVLDLFSISNTTFDKNFFVTQF